MLGSDVLAERKEVGRLAGGLRRYGLLEMKEMEREGRRHEARGLEENGRLSVGTWAIQQESSLSTTSNPATPRPIIRQSEPVRFRPKRMAQAITALASFGYHILLNRHQKHSTLPGRPTTSEAPLKPTHSPSSTRSNLRLHISVTKTPWVSPRRTAK